MGQIMIKVQQQCCSSYYYNKLKQDDQEDMMSNGQHIQEDYKYFFQEQWFAQNNNLLFDPEKFIYIYYGYKQDQLKMEKYWKLVDLHQEIKHGFIDREGGDVLAKKWKYLIRRGVPMDKMRAIILDIFKKTYDSNETEYKSAISVVFKGQDAPTQFKNIMVFQEANNQNLEEILKIQVLKQSGIQILNKICWTLNKQFYQIEYNPMVVQIASLLLIFVSEAETYCILHFMLEDSLKLLDEKSQENNAEQQRSLRWHFMMNKEQYERLGKSFFETIQEKSQTFRNIIAHFKNIGFNYMEFFAELTNSIFVGYLHFPAVIKLFVLFLNEGIKIYLRMAYSLCFMVKDDILANKDPSYMKNLIKNKALKLNQKQIDALIQKGFQLRLVKTKHQLSRYSVNKSINNRDTRVLYLPILKQPSNIVKSVHLESIWESLPNYLKLIEPTLIYSTNKKGFSLNQLYQRTEEFQTYSALYFIKTTKDEILGFFIDQNLKPSSQIQYYGTDETFIFKLQPEEKIFMSSGLNQSHIYSEKDYFTLGSSEQQNNEYGVAIQIDSELNKGITKKCDTYNSEPLVSDGNNFQISEIEVYAFVQEINIF